MIRYISFAIVALLSTTAKSQTLGSLKSFFKFEVTTGSPLADSPKLYWSYCGGGAVIVHDVDGDGTDDAMVTVQSNNNRSLLHQVRINSNGTFKGGHRYTDIENYPKSSINDVSDLRVFGYAAMDNMGDLNGDGVDDLVIGNQLGGEGGEFYLAYPNRSGVLDSLRQFRSQAWALDTTLLNKSYFGCSVANIGDLDGDGVRDVAIGQYGANTLWIVLLTRQGLVKSRTRIYSGVGKFPVLEPNVGFGTASCGIGDLDGDGIPDIISISPDSNTRGSIWTLFMNRNGSVKDYRRVVTTGSALFPDTIAKNSLFGSSVVSIGDVDGDNVPDIAIGEPYVKDVNGIQIGRVHVIMMNSDGTLKARQVIDRTNPMLTSVLPVRSALGYQVFKAGDFNKDGIPDLGASIPEVRNNIPHGSTLVQASGMFIILNLNGIPIKTGTGDVITNETTDLFAYPNPSSSQLTIRTRVSGVAIQRLTVTDVTGRITTDVQPTADQITLDVSGWASGTYLISAFSTSGAQTIKFTKR